MRGDITFQSTTPRDMVVRLDGVAIGECYRNQWRSNGTMLYRWAARLDAAYAARVPEGEDGTAESLQARTKSGIQRAMTEIVRAIPDRSAAGDDGARGSEPEAPSGPATPGPR